MFFPQKVEWKFTVNIQMTFSKYEKTQRKCQYRTCNKVKLLLQTKHGHINNFTIYSTLNMNSYIYILKHTFSQFLVQYTLKLVHMTPNIQET